MRIRPIDPSQQHLEDGHPTCIFAREEDNTICMPTCGKEATFDGALGPSSSQEQTFQYTLPLIEGYLQGYNATVLAYGQTGSGILQFQNF